MEALVIDYTHMDLLIDTYADIVCPWCFIGTRRLESLLPRRPAEKYMERSPLPAID